MYDKKCECCNYQTNDSGNFRKHLSTKKHRQNMKDDKIETPPKTDNVYKLLFESQQAQNVQLAAQHAQNLQLTDQISQLQKQITELMTGAKASNVNNYNIAVNNLKPLTDEDISEHIERLNIEFILQGAKGYADFANKYPFKNHIICTDKARKKIKFKNADGEIVDDPQGRQVTQRFFQTYADKNRQIITTEYHNLQQQVQVIAESGTAGESNLAEILSKASHLQEILQFCNEAAEGKDNKFTQEFVSHLAKII